VTPITPVTPSYLSVKNKHPRDEHITFREENHEYTVMGKKGYTSVTTFVHKHFAHFDNESIVKNILSSRRMTDPEYKYYGMTRETILADWETNRNSAAEAGTKLHYDIECYFNLINNPNDSVEFQYFKDFVRDFPELTPYRTEWTVYYEEYRISGSIDMVFENPDGTIQIYDWKRTKGLEYEAFGNKRAITPCISSFPDTNFWHYSIQLNMYKRILEAKYGKKVTGLYLVCLHPLNAPKTYERVEVPFLDNDISQLLIWWKETHLAPKAPEDSHH
jgi:ATP-dependent exoDNAse (exonuclease V) beta subunit